jgi:hypothetical protein
MTTTYRAAYYVTPDGRDETVLTGPEHAHLDDDDLIAEALAEAKRADIVSDDDEQEPRLTPAALVDGLTIGDWTA